MYISESGKDKIKMVLNQYKGPIKINLSISSETLITIPLIESIIEVVDDLDVGVELRNQMSIEELLSLKIIFDFILSNLGIYDFATCTGLDYHADGIKITNQLKHLLLYRDDSENNYESTI